MEISAVNQLKLKLQNEFLLHPYIKHVLGDVALLRYLRAQKLSITDAYAKIINTLELRENFESNQIFDEILQNDLSFDQLHGFHELQEASHEINPFLGRTEDKGHIVWYERWGNIDSDKFLSQISMQKYKKIRLYQLEYLSMLLDKFSRKEKRMVGFVVIMDCKGSTYQSRKMMDYLNEWSDGKSQAIIPSLGIGAYFVNVCSYDMVCHQISIV